MSSIRNKASWNIFTLFKQDSLTGLERNENNYLFTISKNIITSKIKSTIKDQPCKILLLPIVPNKENPSEITLMWCCIFSNFAWHIHMLFKNMSCRLHRTFFFLEKKEGKLSILWVNAWDAIYNIDPSRWDGLYK